MWVVAFCECIYICGGGGGGEAWAACDGIWKNAMAIRSSEIHIKMKPMRIIVRTAPIKSSIPAVPKSPTPVLFDDSDIDFLKKTAATTTNMKRTTNAMMIPPRKAIISPKAKEAKLDTSVKLETKLAMSPAPMPVKPRLLNRLNKEKTTTPTNATTPTIARIVP